jgi:hypothetical protein
MSLKYEYEQASGNTVQDGIIYDGMGHYIAKYSDEMASEYLDACEEENGDVDEDPDDDWDCGEGRMMAGMAHGNQGLADYDGLELDGPDGYVTGGCEGHQGCQCDGCMGY